MLRSSVTISLVSEAKGGPFVFWHDWEQAIKRASELGFDAVEIFPPGPDAIPTEQLKAKLQENKVALAAVGTGAGWVKHKRHLCLPDPSDRAKAIEFISGVIGWAAKLGAPAIIGSMQGRHGEGVTPEQAKDYLAEGLHKLSGVAADLGVPLIYEPLNRYETNLFNTLEASAAFLKQRDVKNVKLLADLFHMNIEETSIPAAILQAGPWIGHVHFVDSNRQAAGRGHIDFRAVAAALQEIRYHGFLSAEAFPIPDSETAATQTIRAFQEFFGSQVEGLL